MNMKSPILLLCLLINYVLADKYNCQVGYQGKHCDECGLQYETPNLKIVGGSVAVPHSWPQQALVVFNFKGRVLINGVIPYMINQRYLCGGSLISRDTVLTAGHCIVKQIQIPIGNNIFVANVTPNEYFPTMESMYTIYLGIQNTTGIYTAQTLQDGEKMAVSKVIPHPSYLGDTSDSSTNFNDIAIIKLAQEAKLSSTVQLACLPDPNKKDYPTNMNQDVYAMGFGTLSADGPLPNKLYNVKLSLYDGAKCDEVIPDVPKDWSIQICAGELAGGKDTCQGDSGGAIYVKDTLGNKVKYIAVGITSYGDSCALPNEPGIYTKISPYLNWIEDNM